MNGERKQVPEKGIFTDVKFSEQPVKIEHDYALVKDIYPVSFLDGVLLAIWDYVLSLGDYGMIVRNKSATQRVVPDNEYPEQDIYHSVISL
jgi:hypothetical protein